MTAQDRRRPKFSVATMTATNAVVSMIDFMLVRPPKEPSAS